MAVDHAGHDDRAAGVDHLRALLVDLLVRADRLDPTVGDRDADPNAERIGRAVGERGVVQDRAAHFMLPAGPVMPPAGPGCPSPWYLPR